MTSLVGLWGACADVVILLVLAATLARPGLPQLARLVIATLAFAFAWVVTAGSDALRAPDWTMLMGGAVTVASMVAVIATLQLWTLAADGGGSPPEDRGDHGGGGPGRDRPEAPRHGGGGSDPIWWAEFERRLASYVAERERATASVRAPRAPEPMTPGRR